MLARNLILASSGIILTMGLLHLAYTFLTDKFSPHGDAALETRMQQVSPNISRDTTMWNAWVGFNASHSLGVICFGAVYGYLDLCHTALLLQDRFLTVFGGLFLLCYLILARRYWFSVPLAGILLALLLYLGGFAAAMVQA
ncbi:MAG: hypothetical protein JWR07_4891 [Nevskia sp.]|nr:hypothetical protein [Nevskia sp.]